MYSTRKKNRRPRSLRLEGLEHRMLMSITPGTLEIQTDESPVPAATSIYGELQCGQVEGVGIEEPGDSAMRCLLIVTGGMPKPESRVM